jgi:hypothetical protein
VIRFMPDTWRDAILRPIAMAAPDAGVYVEIAAPDFRFAVLLLLCIISLVTLRRVRPAATPLTALLLWLAAAFAVWLATSGNGRYFMPALLVAGPACIGLAARLRATPAMRLTIAGGIVLLQGWTIYHNDPWGWWGLGKWGNEPFFAVELDEQARTEPATYVTISNISYSLIAPRFSPDARWINISVLPDASVSSSEVRRAHAVLAASRSVKLVVPTRPEYMTANRMPGRELQVVINDMIAGQRLALASPLKCRMFPSRGLAGTALKQVDATSADEVAKYGFWVCDLRYPASAPSRQAAADPEISAVFALIENQCPRVYQPGQTSASRISGGWVRVYPAADIRLYVLDTGKVYYKYWRALNPELIGTAEQLRAGLKVDCLIRGRSGLPWEREI